MFDSLTDKLQGAFRRLGGRGTITEKDLEEALRERALGADVTKSLTPMQQIIDIVNQQMIELLGGGQVTLQKAKSPPTVVMLVGLKGSGKTTTAAKLALHLRRGGDTPLMIAADPERVAGSEQLTSLGKQLQIPVMVP